MLKHTHLPSTSMETPLDGVQSQLPVPNRSYQGPAATASVHQQQSQQQRAESSQPQPSSQQSKSAATAQQQQQKSTAMHRHPQHPPPPPPQIHVRPAVGPRPILNRSIPLNVSTLSHQSHPAAAISHASDHSRLASDHSHGGSGGSGVGGTAVDGVHYHHSTATSAGIIGTANTKQMPNGYANGGLRLPAPLMTTATPASATNILNTTPLTSCSSIRNHCNLQLNTKHRIGAREALTSLGLLCLVSLLLALLSLIFLLKISPGGRDPPPPPPGPIASDDYVIVYDVTLALCALSLSLNLCCLLVCALQFLFSVKLLRAAATPGRGNKYLQKSSVSRVCAVGGFFISIPIFLTGIILYTFTQFHSTPAIITSILIGIGIVFCGCAMVHNVFVWQKEKTICVRQQHPLNLNITSTGTTATPISTISPPIHHHYQNHNGINPVATHLHLVNNNNNNTITHTNHNHTPLTHTSQMSHHTTPVTPVTPLSANHSHVSFNHSQYLPNYGHRTATATPPTPKVGMTNPNNNSILIGRDVSGSVTPGTGGGTLDMSNITTISPHELSTLV